MISVIIPVFRNAEDAITLSSEIFKQTLPPDCDLEVVIIDDGSGDDTTNKIHEKLTGLANVISLPTNIGRGGACNAGALNAKGEVLVFIDCDCIPEDRNFLFYHWSELQKGCIASCGRITAKGDGFWSRYQRDAAERRKLQHQKGMRYAGTTGNIAIRRSAFIKSGGFDPEYKRYGFEDRDLLLRLLNYGDIHWCEKATVIHMDELSLPKVIKKMAEAGGASAGIFSNRYPEAYKELGYAALDCRIHKWVRLVVSALSWTKNHAEKINFIIERGWIPYRIGKLLVKISCAIAFAEGSKKK